MWTDQKQIVTTEGAYKTIAIQVWYQSYDRLKEKSDI